MQTDVTLNYLELAHQKLVQTEKYLEATALDVVICLYKEKSAENVDKHAAILFEHLAGLRGVSNSSYFRRLLNIIRLLWRSDANNT